jgi:hypothetical protein
MNMLNNKPRWADSDHEATDAEVHDAMVIEATDALLTAIRKMAQEYEPPYPYENEDFWHFATVPEPPKSPMTACEWLRLEGVL